MTGPPAATAAVRVAVRRALADLPRDALVLAAVSGGADSLALAAGLAFERRGAGALIVDHRLQAGSGEAAAGAARQCEALGLTVEVLAAAEVLADAAAAQEPAQGGPEARARELRYALLAAAAERRGAAAVLLGHTRDDQAETVLLGLARGSGPRALAGMAARRDLWRRPLLELGAALTRAACTEAGLTPWEDPHNADHRFARVRARHVVLPVLERELGPGVGAALARSAALVREDADALDALARAELARVDAAVLPVDTGQLPAIRARVLKLWAERCCDHPVTAVHVGALRDLVERWSGQGPVALPGGTLVSRVDGELVAQRPARR